MQSTAGEKYVSDVISWIPIHGYINIGWAVKDLHRLALYGHWM